MPASIKKRKQLAISTAKQWKAINSPIRLQILALFESIGEMSVANLASELEVPADRLYHHVRTMRDAGILIEIGFRKTARIPEVVYDMAAERFVYDVDVQTGKNVEALLRLNRSVIRNASQTLQSAVESGQGRIQGPKRNLYARYETARLSNEELKKVREHIDAISEIFRLARRTGGGTLLMANCNLAPMTAMADDAQER